MTCLSRTFTRTYWRGQRSGGLAWSPQRRPVCTAAQQDLNDVFLANCDGDMLGTCRHCQRRGSGCCWPGHVI